MTFEERTNAIGALLRETILPRYRRPEHLDDTTARAELRDMVADLNAAWPIMGEQRFSEVAEALARAVRVTHTSRQWPTIAALTKALEAALRPPEIPTAADDAQVEEFLYGLVVEWWGKHHDAMPSVAKERHTRRMVREGVATAGTLRRAGFHIPLDMRDDAMAEPDPRQGAILADIAALGEELAGAPRGDVRIAR